MWTCCYSQAKDRSKIRKRGTRKFHPRLEQNPTFKLVDFGMTFVNHFEHVVNNLLAVSICRVVAV